MASSHLNETQWRLGWLAAVSAGSWLAACVEILKCVVEVQVFRLSWLFFCISNTKSRDQKPALLPTLTHQKEKKKKKKPQRKTEKHIKKRDAARIPGQQKTEEKTDRDD